MQACIGICGLLVMSHAGAIVDGILNTLVGISVGQLHRKPLVRITLDTLCSYACSLMPKVVVTADTVIASSVIYVLIVMVGTLHQNADKLSVGCRVIRPKNRKKLLYQLMFLSHASLVQNNYVSCCYTLIIITMP